MTIMQIDLNGRVNNVYLPYSKALSPLFEAIVNSFQAIEDADGGSDSHIKITIVRDNSQLSLDLEEKGNSPICGFIIEDNGIGFNKANFEAFETSDSLAKQARGGKGIGRLLWLKAFEKADIESVYKEDDDFYKRDFTFSREYNGIKGGLPSITKGKERYTKVTLDNLKQQYRESCPKKMFTIALRIIEHCLVYFMSNTCPQVELMDDREHYNLNRIYNNEIRVNEDRDTLNIKGEMFHITHLKLYSSEEINHKIHLCAHNREVVSENLAKYIPNLTRRIRDEEDKAFLYVAYVFGNFLDSRVNSERTGFNMIDDGEIEFPQEITRQELISQIKACASNYLEEYLKPIKDEKLKKIREYVQNVSPQYRHVLKYREKELDEISPDSTEEQIDTALYRISQDINLKLKEKSKQYLSGSQQIVSSEYYKQGYAELMEQISEVSKSNLVQYVVHRRLILDLFKKRLKFRKDNSYELEESIHSIIFPLRSTSDDEKYENHNLWIIDERLSYHYFLASDKPFSQVSPAKSDSLDRADLIIFNQPLAYVGDNHPFSSVVIIEFKRPERNDYSDEKNPIAQVYDYVKLIKEGHKKDRDGRPVHVTDSTPFYGYIICDITDSMKRAAEIASLFPTPDNMGYFGYNSNFRIYIEIISYDKLLVDAEKRNRVLFEKLHLPLHNNLEFMAGAAADVP